MTLTQAFAERFGRPPRVVARAPGRVNLLGAHIDYSEGWVLPVAIDRAVTVAAAPAEAGRVKIHALDRKEDATLVYDEIPERPSGPSADWTGVPAGVVWALRREGFAPPGLDVAFTSDVPIGAGVSSSAALEMAFLLAWEHFGGFALDGRRRARIGQAAENGYLGVASGVMDQFASLHGRAGHAVLLDCRDLSHELIAVPAEAAILVLDSGVRRRLGASGFNDRRRQCEEAVEVLRRERPEIRTLRDVTVDDWERSSHVLPPELRRRSRHAVEECRRVLDGADALRRGDLETFGRLMRRSHLSSRDLYEVSLPELDLLAAAAWDAPGCWGARLAGGGFGGCVTALVDAGRLEEVRAAVEERFARAFARCPEAFACRIADGASLTLLEDAAG